MADIFAEPQQFIKQHDDGRFEFVEAILRQIENIQKPVRAITVAGPYRNGKSYFATRLALYPGPGKPQQLPGARGFPLGCKVTAETKGIWVWAIDDPVNPGHCALILDTEGLGDVKKVNKNSDNRLLTLVTLISDTLCYNMKAPLDEAALDKLKFISKTAKHILEKQSNRDAIWKMFPKFVLLLRDRDAFDIPDGDYLSDTLNENKIKEEDDIRTKFTSCKYFLLPQPTSAKKLKQLEHLNDSELEEEFLDEIRKICSYVYGSQEKKDTNKINEWCALLKEFIKAINIGAVPDVMSVKDILAHNNKVINDCDKAYCKKMDMILENQNWWEKMWNYGDVNQLHDMKKNECIKQFAGNLKLDTEVERKRCLEEALDKHLNNYEKRKKSTTSEARWKAGGIVLAGGGAAVGYAGSAATAALIQYTGPVAAAVSQYAASAVSAAAAPVVVLIQKGILR